MDLQDIFPDATRRRQVSVPSYRRRHYIRDLPEVPLYEIGVDRNPKPVISSPVIPESSLTVIPESRKRYPRSCDVYHRRPSPQSRRPGQSRC